MSKSASQSSTTPASSRATTKTSCEGYPIIVVSFGFVFVQAARRKLPWPVALPFAINLLANVAFTPIEFGLRNLQLASFDILVVWATIIWMAVAVWRYHRWVTVAQIPSITALNW